VSVGDDNQVLAERIEQIERRIYERFESVEKVRVETKMALDAKLEVMNELRTQINRERGMYVTWAALFAVSTGVAMVVVAMAGLIVKLAR